MDFNILTFHTADNYGAVLQAYALQEFISDMGYSAGIYDYKPPRIKSGSLKVKLSSALKTFHKKESAEKAARYATFRKAYFNLNLENDSKIYISGSDQVWNPTGAMNPMYFLRFVNDRSFRASYAASLGVSKIPEARKEIFKEHLSRFDAVSVREEDAKKLVSPLYDGDVSVNVDPTLLRPAKSWEKLMSSVEGLPKDFILVYLLHIPKNANTLLGWLKAELGCDIVLIDGGGMSATFTKKDIALHNVGPGEFLWLIANAKSVVTSSFHGTAFSIIFKKEFYSVVNPAMPSRISNLLSMCGITAISESDAEFARNIIDWDNVESALSAEQEKSEAYIKSVYDRAQGNFRPPVSGTVEDIKYKCTGCTACEAICPTKAITMSLNNEGFLEPVIDKEKCINCSKCKRECPLNAKVGQTHKKAWYGWHNDKDVRFLSSSGGAFRALADEVLKEGGAVYGAVYTDNWRSVEIASTDGFDISDIQKSKYTVSDPTGVYKKIKEQLENGRKILFCSTPCQNAGLTAYLKRDYDNLLKCDFICGGMPSLDFYRTHLEALEKQYGSKIKRIDFRPKKLGWGKQRLLVEFENKESLFVNCYKDAYFSCFANHHVSVRRTCLDCEFRARHVADVTLADFWGFKAAGVKPNKEGLSLIVANTEKGFLAVENAKSLVKTPLELKYADYAFRSRSADPKALSRRDNFFAKAEEIGFEVAAKPYVSSNLKHLKSYIKVKLRLK